MSTKESFEEFDLEHLDNLTYEQSKTYVTNYFFPLTNGAHALRTGHKKFSIMEHKKVKETYFNRMDKRIAKYYFTEFKNLRKIVYELGKGIFPDKKKLNLAAQFAHDYKPYEDFDDESKEGVQAFLSYIKEILASNDQAQYEYLLKWFANMTKGNKNESIIFLKGPQGIGKSTISLFMNTYVLGRDLCLEAGADVLTSKFNSDLGGKLFVYFEELEKQSRADWDAINTKLKRYTTSDVYIINQKHESTYQAANINNYLINANYSLNEECGRRYFICDVCCKKRNDLKYFGWLRNLCFNNEVGHAFYCYLMEYNTEKFYSQNFPVTKNKLDAYAKRLGSVEMFLKDEFVLKRLDINNILVKEIFNHYIQYCTQNNIKPVKHTIDFNKVMSELNFIHKKNKDRRNVYNVTLDELNKVSESLHWVHELDEYDDGPDVEYNIKDKIKKRCNTNTVTSAIKKLSNKKSDKTDEDTDDDTDTDEDTDEDEDETPRVSQKTVKDIMKTYGINI